MKRLSKKLLAIFLAVVISAFPSLAQATTISGAQDETLDDKIAILTSMLDDSAEIAQGWKQIGISANDVVDLARTGLRPDFKFRDTTAKQIQMGKSDVKNITSLSANSKIASSAAKGSIEPDPHIPQDSKEQDERIAYILRAGHRLYGNMEGTDAYSKNVMYLYIFPILQIIQHTPVPIRILHHIFVTLSAMKTSQLMMLILKVEMQ